MKRRVAAALVALAAACGGATPATEAPRPAAARDPLGVRPALGAPSPYRAPAPEIYRTAAGTTVWLVHRPELPIVSLALVVAAGSADDPPDRPGLAHITAAMLDEGAGTRDAISLSEATLDLGASLDASVTLDGTIVSLDVLKRNLEPAFAIFAEVLARPRFDEREYKRVQSLWKNALRRRADDPAAVARLVSRAVLHGPDAPYGHPPDGRLEVAGALELAEVRAHHAATFGADALLVAAGQITRSELDGLLARSLADWRPRAARPARPPPGPPVGARPRLVLVDRPEAPQAVVSVVLPGVAAGAPEAPLVELVNTALGGSFTSRLNQNLREDRNWTYGAGSAFAHTRGVGPFVARAEVLTHVTALSVREVLGELEKMAAGGLTAGEHQKVRARDLTDLMETHETVSGVAARLAELGTLDLPPDFDAAASRARQAATRDELQRLAARCFQTSAASVVVVGPASELVAQLRTLELGEPERWSADGRPLP